MELRHWTISMNIKNSQNNFVTKNIKIFMNTVTFATKISEKMYCTILMTCAKFRVDTELL